MKLHKKMGFMFLNTMTVSFIPKTSNKNMVPFKHPVTRMLHSTFSQEDMAQQLGRSHAGHSVLFSLVHSALISEQKLLLYPLQFILCLSYTIVIKYLEIEC